MQHCRVFAVDGTPPLGAGIRASEGAHLPGGPNGSHYIPGCSPCLQAGLPHSMSARSTHPVSTVLFFP